MVAVLMMSAKLATLGLLKIKLFQNKGYDVISSVHNVTNTMNQIISHESNYIVDVVITSILYGIDQKNQVFEESSWFKFNNLGLTRGIVFKLNFTPV